MTVTLNDLYDNPDHYLHSFDGEYAVFVPMDRDAYARSIFLDRRIQLARPGAIRAPIEPLLRGRPPMHGGRWIFHVAHCGSTLLANALEQLGDFTVLREPAALRQVAVSRAGALLPLVLSAMAKRYPGAGPTLVKANVPVNFILEDIAALKPADQAILLYHDLPAYVAAVLRSDGHRGWLRAVTSELAWALGDLTGATDAERAGALWAGQIASFARFADGRADVRALDADAFYADPAATLRAAAALFGMTPGEGTIEEIVAGPLFTTYSKKPGEPFDNARRLARRHESEAALRPEIDAAMEWILRERFAAADDRAVLVASAL
ncbi:hypothetical protein [Tsuneonella amylolytica]|uniref:hypothetical protein n=1 Tax=Tsuneonella amylolytica TaxID=2338327 RepID=UPI000EA9BD01|nr:hypothetical protein [Tsuneonella amylolytica]